MDSNTEKWMKAAAEHILVKRFEGVEKAVGSSTKFQEVLGAMITRFIGVILRTASLSEHQSIGRPAADTAAVNTLPNDQYELYKTYLAFVEEQSARETAQQDETFVYLKKLVSLRMTSMKNELIQTASETGVTLRVKPVHATIAVAMVFLDRFVEAVVVAQQQRGVSNVSPDVIVAAQRALAAVFFDRIEYSHGDDNGLELVVPKKRAAPQPKGEKAAKKPKATKA